MNGANGRPLDEVNRVQLLKEQSQLLGLEESSFQLRGNKANKSIVLHEALQCGTHKLLSLRARRLVTFLVASCASGGWLLCFCTLP